MSPSSPSSTRRHIGLGLFALCLACSGPKTRRETFRINPWLPMPTLGVRLEGTSALAIIDTGAETHFVHTALAERLGLHAGPLRQRSYDMGGASRDLGVLPGAGIEVRDWHLPTNQPVLIQEFNPFFRQAGVEVFVSPQQFANDEFAVVLDFQYFEFRRQPLAEAMRALQAPGGTRFQSSRLCTDTAAPAGYLLYVVTTTVGNEEADLILDTGSNVLAVTRSSKAGQALLSRASDVRKPAIGIYGEYPQSLVKDTRFVAGDVERTLNVTVGPTQNDPHCPMDGELGLDALVGCVLVLTPTGAFARCP